MRDPLNFFAALTLCPSDIEKIATLLEENGIVSHPLRNILVTPLFASPDSLEHIRTLKEERNSRVMFDSGGYYVQVGRLTYEELYYPLLQFYRQNHWGDFYTLPDHVPLSQDSAEVVWRKVRETTRYSTLFFQELPPNLQAKAMPVVQGHTYEQVEHCLKVYIDLGVQYIGFGSFGTYGKNSESNIATNSAVELAGHVVKIARDHGIKVHFFGLGVPALVAMIYGVGASSFDSSSWIKSAGFGQIYLPFMRGYNISHRNGRSQLQKGITLNQFDRFKVITEHSCPFCESIDELQSQKMYRTLHNLLVIQETVDMINRENFSTIQSIYREGSPHYQQEFDKWLAT